MGEGTDDLVLIADRTWRAGTAIGLAGIWIGVLVTSTLSPDLVSGSEQERIPLAAFTAWFWGAVASGAFLVGMGKLRGDPDRQSLWMGYTAAVLVIWVIATVAAVATPVVETGTDPTRLPVGVLVAPAAAAVLTGLAGVAAVVFGRPPSPD